ncbi:MAG: DUF3102 domain-containing protein [Gloeocapsa sp. UFS-A4-WI-NPMV-4B04]|jgi:hypothetical protein|nr:DUF3102 domain-containing protein [Gloeocapsa sp. UFS-A4-WI-NPMV-4B04]
MTLRQLSSRLQEQPLEPKTLDFDYASLEPATRIVVQQRTSEIKTLIQRTAQDIFDIGQKLIEVKAKLGHGHFRSWLKVEFEWSVSTATRFMQVAEQFKYTNLIHLSIAASALYELAAPSTPEAARLEAIERASRGELISYSKAKQIADHYQKVTEITTDQSVTIDVDALTVETESSIWSKQEQSPLPRKEFSPYAPLSKASRATQSAAQGDHQPKATPVGLSATQPDHLLLDVLPNHSSLNTDNCLEIIPQSPDIDNYPEAIRQTTDIDLDTLCTSLLLNVDYLSHDQIDALWQVLAHRIELEKLALSNWSDANLKQLNAAALQELEKRHHIALS